MKPAVPRHYAPRRKNGARCLWLNAAPPEPRSTPPLKAKPAELQQTGAAPKAASAASGALKIAAPRATPTQETATQQMAAPQSASDLPRSGQAAPPARPALPAAAVETDGLRAQFPIPNAEALARNIGLAIEQGGKVLAAYLRPRETGEIKEKLADDAAEMNLIIRAARPALHDRPTGGVRGADRAEDAVRQPLGLDPATLPKFAGGAGRRARPRRQAVLRCGMARRPSFYFIKQAYVLTSRWADDLVERADELEPDDRDKARFYLRQVSAALSPSNFVATNPELLRLTLAESGENFTRGLKMLAEDVQAGRGNWRIPASKATPRNKCFNVGLRDVVA